MTATFIRLTKWEEYQHYKDRDPTWVKLHKKMLTSRTWIKSDDATKLLACCTILLAADTGNRIPNDPDYIKARCFLQATPDFGKLSELGFIEFVDENGTVLADCYQTVPDRSLEKEGYREEEEKKDSHAADADVCFALWNEMAITVGLSKAQVLTKSRLTAIKARLRECGGVDGWKVMLGKVAASSYLIGQNDRGWRADLDFVSKQSKFAKIMEGAYDRSGKATSQNGTGINGQRSGQEGSPSVGRATMAVVAAYRERRLRADGLQVDEPDHRGAAPGDSFAFEGFNQDIRSGNGGAGSGPLPDGDKEQAQGSDRHQTADRGADRRIIEVPG